MSDALDERWDPKTEVVAMYNFHGNSNDDLQFRKGEILSIIKATRDPMWYLAKHPSGKEGMIPKNYVKQRGIVQLNAMPWFHGKMGREEAEETLKPKEDGLYLVRESNNYPGDYTLCLCHDNKVEHYHIMYKDNSLTVDQETYFDNLTKLVQHYEHDADGLCTQLVKPVPKRGNYDYSVDKQAFIDLGWRIKEKEIKLGEPIGKGEFGDVFRGEYNAQRVAVKVLKDNSKAAQQFLTEASVMSALRHDNLVQLLGVMLGETIQIVTEFMGKGSLIDYLRSRGRSVITRKDQINFASDTCNGMAYLEKQNFVHRDLAARNVLINDDCTAKVSDFGLARPIDSNQQGGKFPIKWTAPEALKDSMFTSKSDMWSFGILLWEIYSFGRVPYPRIPLADVVMHVDKGYRMESPDGCPQEIYDIMTATWQIQPDQRPSFEDTAVNLNSIRANTS